MKEKTTLIPLVKTPANYKLFPRIYEYNSGEILTVPDEAYSVEQILEKFTRGIKLPIMQEGYYSDSEDFDDVDNFMISDLTDLDQLVNLQAQVELRVKQAKAKAGLPKEPAQKPAGDEGSQGKGEAV